MTCSTNFMMFSFAVLQEQNVMSSKSNCTEAIINGKEEYETLASSLHACPVRMYTQSNIISDFFSSYWEKNIIGIKTEHITSAKRSSIVEVSRH